MELQTFRNSEIAVQNLEKLFLEMPQAGVPVMHHFSPGVYMREVTMQPDTFAIGHYQKTEHLNIMLTGKVLMVNEDGTTTMLEAPQMFVSPPGRKIGYVFEKMSWLNVYPTNETDIDILESMFLDKSETFNDHNEKIEKLKYDLRQPDREDFKAFIAEYSLDPEVIRIQSENTDDIVPMDAEWLKIVAVRKSYIQNKGLFLSSPVKASDIICPARVRGKRTIAGRYTNHSPNPNSFFYKLDNGDIYLMANQDINGCSGGDKGTELTVNYRETIRSDLCQA